MPATPAITLTATLQDYSGNAQGSAPQPAFLRIALCGTGGFIPRIPGTSVLAKVVSWPIDIPYTGTPISVPLWGNDVITPSGTYYFIAVLDTNRNILQGGIYQLTGSGTVDLSNLTPSSGGGQVPLNFVFNGLPVYQNASGTINGTNTQFQFQAPNTPTPTVEIFVAGVLQSPNAPAADYTLTSLGGGNWRIAFTTAPVLGPITVVLFQSQTTSSGYITVPFSATPIFSAAGWTGPTLIFDITLTGNITSSSLLGIALGQFVQFFIQQDATGNRIFTWPPNAKNPPLVNPAANSTTTALFVMRSDGNLYPVLGWN